MGLLYSRAATDFFIWALYTAQMDGKSEVFGVIKAQTVCMEIAGCLSLYAWTSEIHSSTSDGNLQTNRFFTCKLCLTQAAVDRFCYKEGRVAKVCKRRELLSFPTRKKLRLKCTARQQPDCLSLLLPRLKLNFGLLRALAQLLDGCLQMRSPHQTRHTTGRRPDG